MALGLNKLARGLFSALTLAHWRAWHARRVGAAFDRKHGTDTQALVAVGELGIPAGSARHAVHYEASTLPKLRRALHHLGVQHRDYTFVDVGSGKGLVVLTAAQAPFAEVIGVEISQRLDAIARDNLERLRGAVALQAPVTLVNKDALEFDYPAPRQVVYLYNPFDAEVLRQFLDRLESRLEEGADDIVVVYVNPVCRAMVENEFHVEIVYRHATLVIYRLRSRASDTSPVRRAAQRSPR